MPHPDIETSPLEFWGRPCGFFLHAPFAGRRYRQSNILNGLYGVSALRRGGAAGSACKGGSGVGLFLLRDHLKSSRSVRSTTRTAIAIMNPRTRSLPAIMSAGSMQREYLKCPRKWPLL